MTISIYSPAVRAEAMREGITELQAYRKLKSREHIQRMEAAGRRQLADDLAARAANRNPVAKLFDRIAQNFERSQPDWNKY